MFIDPVTEFESIEKEINAEAAISFKPIMRPRYNSAANTVRRIKSQLEAVGISSPKVERQPWGYYWSTEAPGRPFSFRQGHVEIETQLDPAMLPKLTIHEWLFDFHRKTTRATMVLE